MFISHIVLDNFTKFFVRIIVHGYFYYVNILSRVPIRFLESLRIYPPGLWSTKCCTKPYEIRNKNGQTLTIEKGESIIIPIYGLHHDPEYFPEPDKFKPERFLPDNGGVKRFGDHGVFLGFGDGPRTCLGKNITLY